MEEKKASAFIDRFSGQRVAVIGDLMLDRYIWGKANRISQEAPVPVVKVERTTCEPGGAANVMRNLATLGARPIPFGVIGMEEAGDALHALLEKITDSMHGVVRDGTRRTTQKTRVLAASQQVVRIDTEDTGPLCDAHLDVLLERLRDGIRSGGVDAVIVEDYAKGLVSKQLLSEVVALGNEAGIPIMLDPHPANPANVPGLTLMTPNRSEAFALAGAYYVDGRPDIPNDKPLLHVVERLENLWAPVNLLVTLGAHGMALFKQGTPALHIPTKAREVFDVSGAGDTVIAVFSLAHVAGATPEEAAIMANHAAGVVVGKVGTAPVYPDELLNSFKEATP